MQAQQHGNLSTMPAEIQNSGRVHTMIEGNDPQVQNNQNNNIDNGMSSDEVEDLNQNEMEALMALSTTPINIKRGDVVEGVIVRIDQDEILVDIGLKSEGVLSTRELPASGYGSFNELHLNDKVLVYVIQPETSEGHAVLSLKRANTERQWRIAEEQYKNGELLKAKVIDFNKGGLIVDVAGIRGFVPISQILNLRREEVAAGGENQETAAKLQSMKDKELQLKIIEINRARNRLILSERLAVQEWRQRRREELLDELKPGEVRKGIVSNLANFGAFVDLGGADGLVHISQLAWSRVNHPSEVLHVGQEVEVQVLSVDKDKKKIALSIKRAEVDLRIDAERRRLGLSLRQVEELDKEPSEEAPEENSAAAPTTVPASREMPSLAETAPSTEAPQQQEPVAKRSGERRERNTENPLLSGLSEGGGELTAMAEAFRAAARQRSKDESESSDQ